MVGQGSDGGIQERRPPFLHGYQELGDGGKVMELILGQVGRQSRNPVQIPALTFRVLLNFENDAHWKGRLEATLNVLRACTFRVDSFGTQKIKGNGSFLGEWWYQGGGAGSHGDGIYSLHVQPGFLGCLSLFESGTHQLVSGRQVTTYDFGRKLTREEKAEIGWGKKRTGPPAATFSGFDAGRVFYNAAEGFSAERGNLVDFIERELTLKRDGVSQVLRNPRVRRTERAKRSAADANEPRLYDRGFCPILAEGKRYYAALGHFRMRPETGRSLYGVRKAQSAAADHSEGLLAVLGYVLSPEATKKERRALVRKALEDLKAVVVDYAGGVVAARGSNGSWLTLDEAATLSERELGARTKLYLFVPESWKEDRKRKWEARQEERALRGETPHAWKITENPVEALRSRFTIPGKELVGLESAPLHLRLRTARFERGLSLAAVGKLFGVSGVMVYKWEQGAEPEQDGRVAGKPIAPRLIPLMLRWVNSGEGPTVGELRGHARGVFRGGESDAADVRLINLPLTRMDPLLTSR